MRRLTEKSTKYNFYFLKKNVSILGLSNKLGKLEDIEEELGCPLEVVSRALKEGIVVPECDAWFPTVGLEKSKVDDDWYLSAHSIFLTLKDYKKTWWLPSDEEWKDE